LALLFIWINRRFVALCGALTYGELAARISKSGGEYVFLSRIFHPSFGFLSGFISMTIGFAAPMAICAIALGTYAGNLNSAESYGYSNILFYHSHCSQFQQLQDWCKF